MINRRADRPIFQQLADLLREQITSGALQPGDRLPTQHRLAQEHGVGKDTAEAAFAVLRAEGLIETRVSRGSVVRAPVDPEEFSLQRGSRVRLRMPTPQERDELDLAEGVPVAVVRHGARTRVLAGDRWEFIVK